MSKYYNIFSRSFTLECKHLCRKEITTSPAFMSLIPCRSQKKKNKSKPNNQTKIKPTSKNAGVKDDSVPHGS